MPSKPGDPLKVGDKAQVVMGPLNTRKGVVERIERPMVYVKMDSGETLPFLAWQLVKEP